MIDVILFSLVSRVYTKISIVLLQATPSAAALSEDHLDGLVRIQLSAGREIRALGALGTLAHESGRGLAPARGSKSWRKTYYYIVL